MYTYINVLVLMSLCAQMSACNNDTGNSREGSLAQTCARHLVHKSAPVRSRLHDEDIQQGHSEQEESVDVAFSRIRMHMRNPEAIQDLSSCEQALRVIAQYYVSGAAWDKCAQALQYAGFIKLMQDPFWYNLIANTPHAAYLEQIGAPPTSIDMIDQELAVDTDGQAEQVVYMVDHEQEIDFSQVTAEQLRILELAMRRYKRDAQQLLEQIHERIVGSGSAELHRPVVISKQASADYNRAMIAEIDTDIAFNRVKDPKEYVSFELKYGAVVQTYFYAHEQGHPTALRQAETVLSGPLSKIVDWKQEHKVATPTAMYASLWAQYNQYKREDQMHTVAGSTADGPASSSGGH